jgi:transcriptional regulator with XRE-family HTH domain
MNFNTALGNKIRSQREKLGFKQQDIARSLQVTPQAVSKWAIGENAPEISLLVVTNQLSNKAL